MTPMTQAARRGRSRLLDHFDGVAARKELARLGMDDKFVAAHVAAGRWSVRGGAVLLHNGEPTPRQLEAVALINCGPRAVLTSFTSAERWGLKGWAREEIHVLGPAGTTDPGIGGVILHRTGDWSRVDTAPARRLHHAAPSLVIAASSFAKLRPAVGLLAAGVQQRVVRPALLRAALDAAPRTRHRRALRLAVDDIEGGAQALSEIDFARLCRRGGLPEPLRQQIRMQNGKRRYLDAEWQRSDGSRVVAEVDGALHLAARSWWDDQVRQNELVIAGDTVLRFPTAIVRFEPDLVLDQLRRIRLR